MTLESIKLQFTDKELQFDAEKERRRKNNSKKSSLKQFAEKSTVQWKLFAFQNISSFAAAAAVVVSALSRASAKHEIYEVKIKNFENMKIMNLYFISTFETK